MSTDRGGFTARSIGKTFLLFVVTLGFYGLYWIHQLHQELKAETGADYNPTVRTIGMIVPSCCVRTSTRRAVSSSAVVHQTSRQRASPLACSLTGMSVRTGFFA